MYELLLVLVRHPDRILEKEFLLQSVWPDSFVEEGSISFNIRQLRKALGDDAQTPLYIETVPRRGYRFVAKVEESVEDEKEPRLTNPDPETSRRSNSLMIGLGFAALVLIAGLAGIWFLSSRSVKAAPILSAPFTLERLSTDGQVHLSVISPDGKTVVYSRRNAGKQSLWVMQVGTSETSQIVPASGYIYFGLALSPDGNFIYYARVEGQTGQQADIYRESVYGGVPQRVVSEAQGWISLSPDGKKISFVRCPYSKDEYCSLWVADSVDGSNERKLITRSQPIRIGDNKFSPDGKSIAFAVGESRTYSNDFGVSLVDVETGQERELTREKFFNVGYLAWLPGQQGLLMTARQEPDKSFRIWQVSTGGEVSPLTDDSQTYSALSLNADGSVLVTTRVAPSFHLNIYSLGDTVAGPSKLVDAQTVSFAPNGDIFFSSARTGNHEIWSIKSDGSGERQLTNNPSDDVAPIVSPDNNLVFFASNRTGKVQIWKMKSDGSDQSQVTLQEGGEPSLATTDGKWLYYKSALEKKLMRVSLIDGHDEIAFDRPSQDSVIAPTGDRVALTEKVNGENVLNIDSLADGSVMKTLKYPEPRSSPMGLAWSRDSKYIAYVLADVTGIQQTLWFQPVSGETPRKIADLHEDVFELSNLALSPDNKTIAVIQGTWNHDAVVITGLK